MVTLELKKAGFGEKEKWPLLYAFADIYLNVASRNQPLNDTQVVEVAKQRYGLVVERRTVRKYRDYLSSYFGLRLETKSKGHYASSPIVVERKRRPRRNTFLERFENFTADEEEKESITKKARTIVSAISAGRCLSLLIPHWIDAEYGWDPYPLGPKRLIVIPLRIFQYRHEYYLLAYVPEEKSHFVFLIRNVTIKRSKAPRQAEGSVLDFDLEAYVKKQAFLFTGPVSQSDKPTYLEASWGNASWNETSRITYIVWSRWPDGVKCSMPFLAQSLIDLYGESNIQFSSDEDHQLFLDFPNDLKAEAILNSLKEQFYTEIGFMSGQVD